MMYKLYKGYILDVGTGSIGTAIYASKYSAENGLPVWSGMSEEDALKWVDDYGLVGQATQEDVDAINASKQVEPRYSAEIMEAVRQRLGLESWDTSKDNDINNMGNNAVFDNILIWEGIIGYSGSIKRWVEEIYGVKLEGW